MSQARPSDENTVNFTAKPTQPFEAATRVPLRELTPVHRHTDLDTIDQELYNDPCCLGCYAQDIFSLALVAEPLLLPLPTYMKQQIYVTPKMRSVLIDWLVTVHFKFELRHETLYLTVNVIDRYLSRHSITTNELQLLGVTALFIACKYEEIFVPLVSDLVFISDRAYTKEQIIVNERKVLRNLEYNLGVCSEYLFFKRFATLEALHPDEEALGLYLLELSLVNYNMLKYKNSLKAASAVNLVNKMTKGRAWSLHKHSGYSEEELRTCCRDLVKLWQTAPKSEFQGVREKFSRGKFSNVAQKTYNL